MSHTGYADAIVSGMLGWLKGFASWVLKLFNLAGSGGISPLKWLSDNWLNMLIVLMVLGVVADWVVWLIRWRPHWVWFRKKRVIVDDEDFFVGEDVLDAGMYDENIFGREALRNAVTKDEPKAKKPNTIVRRDSPRPRPAPQRHRTEPVSRARPTPEKHRSEEPGARTKPAPVVKPKPTADASAKSSKRRPAHKPQPNLDIFEKDMFKLEPSDAEARKLWEDDVFNVSNLPAGKKKRLGALIVREEDVNANDDPFRVG